MGSFTAVNSKRKRYKRIMLKMLKRPCKKCFELILEGKKRHIALSCCSIIRYKCDYGLWKLVSSVEKPGE
jgi:hypothetical protein